MSDNSINYADLIINAIKTHISEYAVEYRDPTKKMKEHQALDKPTSVVFRLNNRVLEKFSISYEVIKSNGKRYISNPKFGFQVLDSEYYGVRAIEFKRNFSTNPKKFIVGLDNLINAKIHVAYKAKRGLIYIDLTELPLTNDMDD